MPVEEQKEGVKYTAEELWTDEYTSMKILSIIWMKPLIFNHGINNSLPVL